MDDEIDELLHPLLASRWSPTVFDPSREVRPAEVESLLEAARWDTFGWELPAVGVHRRPTR